MLVLHKLVGQLDVTHRVLVRLGLHQRTVVILGLIVVLGLLPVGAAAADGSTPFTVTSSLQMETALLEEASVIWFGAVAEATNDAVGAVGLRWVKEASSWFPSWSLQLVAQPGILATHLVTDRDSNWEWIELSNLIWLFEPGHTYQTRIAFDPATHQLSYAIGEPGEKALQNGTVVLGARVKLVPLAQSRVEQLYPHVGEYTTSAAFSSLGAPLEAQALQMELVESSLGVGAPGHSPQFELGSQPGLRLTWPKNPLPGEVVVQLRQAEKVFPLGTASWSATPQVMTFSQAQLPWGEATLELVYVLGTQKWVVAQSDFRYIQGIMEFGAQVGGRDDAGNLLLKATFNTSSAVTDFPLEFVVTYAPKVAQGQTQSWTQTDVISFAQGKLQEVVYRVPAPPYAGTVSITATAPMLEKRVIARGDMQFTVEDALAFRAHMQGQGLQAQQGQPALLRTGSAFPTVQIDRLYLGEQQATLRAHLVGPHNQVQQESAHQVAHGMQLPITFAGDVTEAGLYQVRLTLERTGAPCVYQTLHFRAVASDTEESMAKQLAYLGKDGRLQYTPDYLGNQIPDYSYAGYMGGGVPIPTVPVQRTVAPGAGDDGQRIQAAINEVSALPPDANGFRGAVLLKKGTYEISDSLQIAVGGVVLRGEGDGEDGTVLVATGSSTRTLIQVNGLGGVIVDSRESWAISDLYVPVGARSFHVASTTGLQVGDLIVIRRYGNAEWISEIGMDKLPLLKDRNIVQWQPFHLDFERTITDISGDRITIDASLTSAIEQQWGGGQVFLAKDLRSEQIGVENLRAISEYDDQVRCLDKGNYPCDESHSNYLVSFNQVKHAWARNLTAVHFAHGMVLVSGGAKALTIQDVYSLSPVSTLEGSRRYPNHVLGQLILLQRAYSDGARHAFALNKQVTGPNVFLHSKSENDHANSEPHRLWAVGGLYDNVVAPIAIQDRYTYGSGHGWSGANFTAWNVTGDLKVQKPPTAQNWVIGHIGFRHPGSFTPRVQGYTWGAGGHVTPQSLYLQQLQDRMGRAAVVSIGYPQGVNTVVQMGDPRKTSGAVLSGPQAASFLPEPPILANGAINLLPNPGMAGAAGEIPDGWERYTQVADVGKDIFFQAEEGSWGVQVFTIDDQLNNKGYGIRSKPQPVQVGATYTASALVRAEDGGKGYVYVDFLDAAGKRVLHKSATSTNSSWTPTTATQTAPEGAVSVTVLLYSDSKSTGKAFFDYAGLEVQ